MTRDLEDDNYYALKKGSKIPLKWTAPETIFYKKYSTNSDVWSYGMLMYEIWSLGHKPFEEVDTQEVCVCCGFWCVYMYVYMCLALSVRYRYMCIRMYIQEYQMVFYACFVYVH